MYTGGPRRGRFGGQNTGVPGDPAEGMENPSALQTPFARREALINRLRERRANLPQATPGLQPGGFAAPGAMRARVLERLNNLRNPSAPTQEKGPE